MSICRDRLPAIFPILIAPIAIGGALTRGGPVDGAHAALSGLVMGVSIVVGTAVALRGARRGG